MGFGSEGILDSPSISRPGWNLLMRIGEFESILVFVSDLDATKRFHVELLGFPNEWSYIATTEVTMTVGIFL
jgi:hypothetical protein